MCPEIADTKADCELREGEIVRDFTSSRGEGNGSRTLWYGIIFMG